MPRNLVVIRAGDQSLHESWLAPDVEWDLLVSYYGDDPQRFARPGVPVHHVKGGKLEGLYDLFTRRPDLLDRYDYAWLPDDDVVTDRDTVARVFAQMRAHDLTLAQPALTADSYFSHQITVGLPGIELRLTNFAEVMVPCMRTEHLRRILPLFKGARFGWGVDNVWSAAIRDPVGKVAILDDCRVRHTRPISSAALYKTGDPRIELNAILARFERPQALRHIVFDAITLDGRRVGGGLGLLWAILGASWRVGGSFGEPRYNRIRFMTRAYKSLGLTGRPARAKAEWLAAAPGIAAIMDRILLAEGEQAL